MDVPESPFPFQRLELQIPEDTSRSTLNYMMEFDSIIVVMIGFLGKDYPFPGISY
jgi:hypothetical protein